MKRKGKKLSKRIIGVSVLAVFQWIGMLWFYEQKLHSVMNNAVNIALLGSILLIPVLLCRVSSMQLRTVSKRAGIILIIAAVGCAYWVTGNILHANQSVLVKDVEITISSAGKNNQANSDEIGISAWIENGTKRPTASLVVKENAGATYYEDRDSWLIFGVDPNEPKYLTLVFPGSVGQYQIQFSQHSWAGIVEINANAGENLVTKDLFSNERDLYLYSVPVGAPLPWWQQALVYSSYALPLTGGILPLWLAAAQVIGMCMQGLRKIRAKRKIGVTAQTKNVLLLVVASAAVPFSYLLFLFTNNSAEIMFSTLLELATVVAIAAIVVYIITYTAAKHPMTAYLASLLFLVVMFVSGYLDDVVQKYCGDAETMWITLCIAVGIYSLLMLICLAFRHRRAKEINMSTIMISIVTAILLVFNVPKALGIYQEQMDNLGIQYIKTDYKVDETITDSPNIYWIHCDGMLGFDAVEKYYGDEQDELKQFLSDYGFQINSSAMYEGGRTTISCVPSLLCPDFYDHFLTPIIEVESLTEVLAADTEPRGIAVSNTCSTLRANAELTTAFRKQGYTISLLGYHTWQLYFADTDEQYEIVDSKSIYKSISQTANGIRNANENGVDQFMSTFIRPIYMIAQFLNAENHIKVAELDVERLDPSKGNTSYVIATESVINQLNERTLTFIPFSEAHTPFDYDENGVRIAENNRQVLDYAAQHRFAGKILMATVESIVAQDPNAVIVLQGDHALHWNTSSDFTTAFGEDAVAEELWNCVISAIRVPEQYQNGEEIYAASNPLNMSRYLVNRFVGKNYEYLPANEPLQ